MEPWQRFFARAMLRAKLSELHTQEFESFFHRLMELRYNEFLGVRTYGNIGDLSADGLLVSERKLYACYAPEVFDESRVKKKFKDDLAGALQKRSDEFDTFVFVHNDIRGITPTVASAISAAKTSHPHLAFEPFGLTRFQQELRKLGHEDIEDLLGPFPAQEMVSGVGMDDLAPLLDHLAENRRRSAPLATIPIPRRDKLEYNEFSSDLRASLIQRMGHVHLVEFYYQNRADLLERDEVASAFRAEYQEVCENYTDPDDVFDQLQQYILGNKAVSSRAQFDAQIVLMYFFGECEIFKIPPEGWHPVGDDYTEAAG